MPDKTIDKTIEEFEKKFVRRSIFGVTIGSLDTLNSSAENIVKDFLRSSLTEYRKSIEGEMMQRKYEFTEDKCPYNHYSNIANSIEACAKCGKKFLSPPKEDVLKEIRRRIEGTSETLELDGVKTKEYIKRSDVLNIIDTKE